MEYRYLNLKYILCNIFYYMLVCCVQIYTNNFLQFRGFSASDVGIVFTVLNVCALLGQLMLAPVVDRAKHLNEKTLLLASLGVSAILSAFLTVLPDGSFWIPVCVVIICSLAEMLVPFLNSIALIYERNGGKINFGLGRGIGSVSYAIAGQITGWLISRKGPGIYPFSFLFFAAASVLTIAMLPKPERSEAVLTESRKRSTGGLSLFSFFRKYKRLVPIVLSMILIFTCHSILHTFMIDIIREIGGNESSQGTAVMIQALLELIPMMMIGRIMKKIPVESLMIFSAIFYSVKHLVVFLAGNMGVFYFGLVFQIVSYGVIIPASVYLANKYIAPEDLNQGQAVMTATVSAGGILASYSGGALINAFSAHTALLFGVILSVTGTILMIFGIARLKQTAGRPV